MWWISIKKLNNQTNNSVLNSPPLVSKKLDANAKTMKKLCSHLFHLEAQHQRKKGVTLPDNLGNELFDENTEYLAVEYFDTKKVSMDDVSRLLFMESLKNAHTAEKSRSRRVCHSPLMTRFCVGINHKLKCEWPLLSHVFCNNRRGP
jgi:hypothetical protein